MSDLFNRKTFIKPGLITGLLLLSTLFLGVTLVQAFWNFGAGFGGSSRKGGIVAAKGIVLGSNNKPIWVEYNSEGYIAREIGEAHGEPLENAFVMAADVYCAYVKTYTEVRNEYSRHYEVLTKRQYEGRIFTDSSGGRVNKPPLQNNTYSVVVRTPEALHGSLVNPVLHESPLNLINGPEMIDCDSSPEDRDVNVVLLSGEDRQILDRSRVNIGYKSAYYTAKDGTDDSYGLFAMYGYMRGDNIWGPLQGVKVSMAGGTKDQTDENGQFTVGSNIGYSPFPIHDESGILAVLRMTTFNPLTNDTGYYYEYRPVYGIYNSSARLINFTIDVSMLAGKGAMENTPRFNIPMSITTSSIPLGGDTTYAYVKPLYTRQDPEILAIPYDFDGNGTPDQMRINADGSVNVWLGNKNPDVDEPDFSRLADFNPDFMDRGLLQEIKKEDLEKTDIYVYRVSNSQLIGSRSGLRPSESNMYHGGSVSGDYESLVNFRMLIAGPASFSFQGRASKWEKYQTAMNQDEALHGLVKDHLKTGELVRVIMINRATGYIGSAVTAMGSGRDLLSFSPGKIIMRPPNLTINAKRKYTVEMGPTKGEERNYFIGFEGSGLTSDEVIHVTTEFYDWDGTPFPDKMPGFVGRLAKVVEGNKLEPVSGKLANFDIKPGTHTQVLQLPQDVSKAHYYIHVSPEHPDKTPTFSDNTFGTGEQLQYRPKYYAPVKVNLYNEKATVAINNEYKEEISSPTPDAPTPAKPDPVYTDVYRPEMQFSLYDLKVKKLELEKDLGDGDTEKEVIDIQAEPDDLPKMFDDDVLFAELFYDLSVGNDQALPYFGPGSELVFAVGGEEVIAYIQADGSVKFDDLEHVDLLEDPDYLALRLYQHGDDANILWEYAFVPIYIEKKDPEFPDVELPWDDYYPPLGEKFIVIKSGVPLEGRKVKAKLEEKPPAGLGEVKIKEAESDTAGDTAEAVFKDGKAKFKLSGKELVPSVPFNEETDRIKISFTLLEKDNTTPETKIEGTWYIRNNSCTTLDDVLKDEDRAVFVYDKSTDSSHQGKTEDDITDDKLRKFDFVEELLNQVVPRKRSISSYKMIDENGIFNDKTVEAVKKFREGFKMGEVTANRIGNTKVNYTVNDDGTADYKNDDNTTDTFRKLTKDYDLRTGITTTKKYLHKIVDKETLVGVEERDTDDLINKNVNPKNTLNDTGLFELYKNVVKPFVDEMVKTAEAYKDATGFNNKDGHWKPRTYPKHPAQTAGVSYCYSAKGTIQDFIDKVTSCQIPDSTLITTAYYKKNSANQFILHDSKKLVNSTEVDTDYDGDINDDNCEVNATENKKKYPGLKQFEWNASNLGVYYLLPNDASKKEFKQLSYNYWTGIDCSGLVYRTLRGGKDKLKDRVKMHPAGSNFNKKATYLNFNVGASFHNKRVYKYGRSKKRFLKKGDILRYPGHVTIMYSEKWGKSVLSDEWKTNYDIIHASGYNEIQYRKKAKHSDAEFSRKVVITSVGKYLYKKTLRNPIRFGRIKLWD